MNAGRITKAKRSAKAGKKPRKRAASRAVRPLHDWSRFDAMTDDEVTKAALSDPDAQPLTPVDTKRMKRVAQAKIIRQALGMSQEEFAEHFAIPIGTLRDWEQGRAEPDQAARSYLKVIARKPDVVRKALEPAA
jgi:putative transcriptional regulator